MSEFSLRLIKNTGIYERRKVVGFPNLRVDSLHHYYNRDVITGYALVDQSTGNYIHIEPTIGEMRKWMSLQNLNFPVPKKRRTTKKAARKTNFDSNGTPEVKKKTSTRRARRQ